MSKRAEKGEVGSRERKGRKRDEMRTKGRAARFKVGPRAPSSRAARDDHAPVSTSAPNGPFEPRTATSHLVRSFSNPRNVHLDPGRTGTVCAKDSLRPAATWSASQDPLCKRVTSATMCNFRIVKSSSGQSRNLNQKMTPWHKEHSNGLRSQDHILRTQARLCARPVPLKSRRNKAVLKIPEFSHRRCHACAQSLPDSQQVDPQAQACWKEDTFMHDVELSDRQEFTGSSRNPDRKNVLQTDQKHPGGLCSRDHISQAQARIPANPEPCKIRQRKLSDGTKNVEIRHRELGQIRTRTGTRFEKKRAGSKTRFSSRTAAFARRVFPDSQQVDPRARVRWKDNDSGYDVELSVRRRTSPVLTGIFMPEEHTKTAPAPRLPGAITLSSELRFAQTLYRWKEDVESFPEICCMTHFEFQKTSKTAPENRIKKGYARENRGGFRWGAGVEG
uniref:Uncharacterized protein n=1 Tax=Fagus sylvatica TaxID=28930 RepID=A0A2N9GSA8_FAGSY